MSHIPIVPEPPTGGKRPPNLYSGRFAADFLALPHDALARAVHGGVLREYGIVRIPRWEGGPFHVFTSAQIAQWLGMDRSAAGLRWEDRTIRITAHRLDAMLQAEVNRLYAAGALPPNQEYISSTPHDRLAWWSNYAHHGGRTK